MNCKDLRQFHCVRYILRTDKELGIMQTTILLNSEKQIPGSNSNEKYTNKNFHVAQE